MILCDKKRFSSLKRRYNMSIVFHEKSKVFHLSNSEVSYIIRIMENGQLENLYYGKSLKDREDFSYLHEESMRSQMSINSPEPSILSMHYTGRNIRHTEQVIIEALPSLFCKRMEAGSSTTSIPHTIFSRARRIWRLFPQPIPRVMRRHPHWKLLCMTR